MLASRSGFAAIALSTLVFAGTAAAQGTTAPAKVAPATAKPAAPAKAVMPSVSATVRPVSATAAAPAAPAKTATPAAPAKTAAPAAPAKAVMPSGGPRTIVGEVIDPSCWIINGAGGKGHAECAAACAKAGQTLAILEKKTNKVYILAGDKPGENPNKGVAEYVGQPVLVKGRVYARGGAIGLRVESIEPYNAKLAAETP